MAVHMNQVWQAASELVDGHAAPSVRLALWSAALSPRNDLENNGRQVDNLRPYATTGLPCDDVQTLLGIISKGKARKCTAIQASAVLRIDAAVTAGQLDWVAQMPRTLPAWLAWRVRVASLYGMSWKTASFAALLLWPFDVPFVPVDTHVCKRLGRPDMADKISDKGHAGYLRYRSMERRVFAEWRAAGKPCPIALWHWLKWDEQRASDSVESHALLSPYAY